MARSSSARWLAPVYVCACCGEETLDGRQVCEDHTGSLWDVDYTHPTNVVRYDAGQLRRPMECVNLTALLRAARMELGSLMLLKPDWRLCLEPNAQPEAKPAASLWDNLFG